jgi:hypothetical protein
MCHPDGEIHAALNAIRTRKVRRLPVVKHGESRRACSVPRQATALFRERRLHLRGVYWHSPPAKSRKVRGASVAGVVFTCALVRTPAPSPQRRWGISPNRRQSQGANPATQALMIRYLADGLLLGTA